MTTLPAFRKFFLRVWVWHLILSIGFLVVVVVCKTNYTNFSATRTEALTNLVALPLAAVHAIILLLVTLRLFMRKQVLNGSCLLVHFLLAAVLVMALYLLMLPGWAYLFVH